MSPRSPRNGFVHKERIWGGGDCTTPDDGSPRLTPDSFYYLALQVTPGLEARVVQAALEVELLWVLLRRYVVDADAVWRVVLEVILLPLRYVPFVLLRSSMLRIPF